MHSYCLSSQSIAQSLLQKLKRQLPCHIHSRLGVVCCVSLLCIALCCGVECLIDFTNMSIGLAGQAGVDNGTAANGDSKDLSNSLNLNGKSGTASSAVKEASSKGNGISSTSAQGGGHHAFPNQEGAHSDKGQHAGTMQDGPAGSSPTVTVTGKAESDTAKTAGSDSEDRDAETGHHDAAQVVETGIAQKGAAAADVGAGKKKHNKGKKKKRGK